MLGVFVRRAIATAAIASLDKGHEVASFSSVDHVVSFQRVCEATLDALQAFIEYGFKLVLLGQPS